MVSQGTEIQLLLQFPAKSAHLKAGPISADVSDDSLSYQISHRSYYLTCFAFLLPPQAEQASPGAENASTNLLITAILKSLLNKCTQQTDNVQRNTPFPLVLFMLALI